MTRRADFVIENAALIATCAGAAPRRGPAQHDISPVRHGSIAAADGRILYVGPAAGLARAVDVATDAVRVDARGCVVVPGFVDAHTHVVFAGDRRQELQRRLAGATYAEIAADGGGIARTVEATRRASEDELVAATRARLDEMLACGTTTAEAKSGYGLTTDSELQQLRVIRRLDAEHPVDLVPTFMGAHDVPVEYRVRRREYVSLVINEMIPRVRRDRLAEWCDVFCETGVFTPDESTTILKAGAKAG